MSDNTHVKDADELISFFSDMKRHYEMSHSEESLISFCLKVLNAESFNMNDVESSISDLNSILSIISRDLSGERLEKFNSIVKVSVNKIDMWLHGVYNHKINPNDASLLFGDFEDVSYVMTMASKKILRDDYFAIKDYNGYGFNMHYDEYVLDEEEAIKTAHDCLYIENGVVGIINNNVPWTDRRVLWTGNKTIFNNRLNSKYRKVKDKRLVAILKSLYETIGDGIIDNVITIEKDSLASDKSYAIDCKKSGNRYSVEIRKV